MQETIKAGLSAMVSGTMASIATTGALMLLARAEGKAVVRPTNATSHWLHGNRAGISRTVNAKHTLLGYATHHASALLWAFMLERWLLRRRRHHPLRIIGDASAVSALAAIVDYGMVPKRLTPGWELVLSKRSIAAVYAALALGLAAGALVTQELRNPR